MNVSRARFSAHSSVCRDVNGWSGAEPGSAVLVRMLSVRSRERCRLPKKWSLSLPWVSFSSFSGSSKHEHTCTHAHLSSATEPVQLCIIRTIRTAQSTAEVCNAIRLQAGGRRTMSACAERGGLAGFPPTCAGSSGLAVLECTGNNPLQSIFPLFSSNLAAALLGNRFCRNSGHMLLVYLSGM